MKTLKYAMVKMFAAGPTEHESIRIEIGCIVKMSYEKDEMLIQYFWRKSTSSIKN